MNILMVVVNLVWHHVCINSVCINYLSLYNAANLIVLFNYCNISNFQLETVQFFYKFNEAKRNKIEQSASWFSYISNLLPCLSLTFPVLFVIMCVLTFFVSGARGWG